MGSDGLAMATEGGAWQCHSFHYFVWQVWVHRSLCELIVKFWVWMFFLLQTVCMIIGLFKLCFFDAGTLMFNKLWIIHYVLCSFNEIVVQFVICIVHTSGTFDFCGVWLIQTGLFTTLSTSGAFVKLAGGQPSPKAAQKPIIGHGPKPKLKVGQGPKAMMAHLGRFQSSFVMALTHSESALKFHRQCDLQGL